MNLIKSYLLPILITEEDIEPTVIMKTNPFILLKFGYVQLLDIMNILGGATSVDTLLKVYKKVFSPTDGLITLTKCSIQNFSDMTILQ